MRLVDLSRPLRAGMPVFPGDPEFSTAAAATLAGEGFVVTSLHLSTHTGTHVDAPAHVVPGGQTLDELPLDLFTGPCVVVDAVGVPSIGPELLPAPFAAGTVVLFHTGWDAHEGGPAEFEHPFLTVPTALRLRELDVRTVGIDCASVDPPGPLDVHRILLGVPGDPGVVVENLANLSELPTHGAHVDVFPLRLQAGDGSPVRAVARFPSR